MVDQEDRSRFDRNGGELAGPQVSVVIPTHDRRDALSEVLSALESQQKAPRFEVVVVDDGSSDGTSDWLEERTSTIETVVVRQENLGPAAARNQGVAVARGQWVAFLGDDTVPSSGWLAAHFRALEAAANQGLEPAILGYTKWHRRMKLDPFLRYINDYGLQFGYALIEDAENLPFNFFYTSNLSLRRQLLLKEPFDEAFPHAAWEDTELSYRLERRGLKLLYRPQAVVEHDHPTTLERFCQRQYRAGYSAVVFYRRHPELGAWLGIADGAPPELPSATQQKIRKLLTRILERGLQLFGVQKAPGWLSRLWEDILRYHYIEGLQQAWEDRAGL